jgi:hypothetical protein
MRNVVLGGLMLLSWQAGAGIYGPCKIASIVHSDTNPNLVLVKMQCQGVNLPTTCTNILPDTIAYEQHTELGKFRTSLILSAFMAGKDVQISSWGSCPAEMNNVPLMYGITVKQ